MTDRTYLYGYASPTRRLTLAQLEQQWQWHRLHPEFKRRLIALFDHSQDVGREVGIGGGARSIAGQEKVFTERHTPVLFGGCCRWQGKRWKLRNRMAHAAPPGGSYHEEDAYENCAVAADLVGDLVWMRSVAAEFGFREFADKQEAWHVQPLEFADARAKNGARTLRVWNLPSSAVSQRPVLKARVVGPDVGVLQRALNTLAGNALVVDGVMGRGGATENAVRAWQAFFKLPVTGVVDAATWKSIYDIAALRGYEVV